MTLAEAEEWAAEAIRQRGWWMEALFGAEKNGRKTAEDAFCEACRAAKKDVDCSSCSRRVEIKGEEAGQPAVPARENSGRPAPRRR